MAIGINAIDIKKNSKCLKSLYEEKLTFKDDMLEMSRNIVRKKHEELQRKNSEIVVIHLCMELRLLLMF